MIENPIISGFYPDPSIVRVEDDFYLVTSSFSFFPGIPIFHSKNLTDWEQIGNVLDRESQLPLTYEMMSSGIFAPTIRYHNGTFYVITTNASMMGKNFVVTATDPEGPWSEIKVIEGAGGIDPSLFFDDDGKVYYTGTAGYNDQPGIWCSEINIDAMELVGERKTLWQGALAGAKSPEGPHIYKKDGWYYLMISEGGTEHYHAITISRSKNVMGPYEGYRGNPILTHRHLGKDFPICNVGHGDLVELKDGSWYMVMLGSRLVDGYHKILGRETFLAPVIWEDEWPVVSCGTGKVELKYPSPKGLPASLKKDQAFFDSFENKKLDFQWNFLGTPYEKFLEIKDGKLHLQLLKKQTIPWELNGLTTNLYEKYQLIGKTKECVSFVGKRQQHINFEAMTKLYFFPEQEETAGMVILQNNAHQIRLEVFLNENNKPCVRTITDKTFTRNKKQFFEETIHGVIELASELKVVYLKISGKGTEYQLYAGSEKNQLKKVGDSIDGSFLGSESSGGFVGTYIGLFASGVSETKKKTAAFDWFDYRPVTAVLTEY